MKVISMAILPSNALVLLFGALLLGGCGTDAYCYSRNASNAETCYQPNPNECAKKGGVWSDRGVLG